MSRYYNFADFMKDVINEADSISKNHLGRGIEDLVLDPVSDDDNDGCGCFALIAIIVLALVTSGLALLLIPLVWSSFSSSGKKKSSSSGGKRQKYLKEILPEVIKDVGEKYKNRWESVRGNQAVIDKLRTEASEELYNKALSATRNV